MLDSLLGYELSSFLLMSQFAAVLLDKFAHLFHQTVVAGDHPDRRAEDQIVAGLDALTVEKHAGFMKDSAILVIQPESCLFTGARRTRRVYFFHMRRL